MNGTRLHYKWVLRRKDNAQRLWSGTKLFQCPTYSEDGLRLELVRERWFIMNATCLSSVCVEAGPDGLGLEFKDSDGHPTGAKVAQRFHQEFRSAKAAGKLDWLDESSKGSA